MRDSACVEKSHSSVLGMMGTRGAGEEKTPAAVETSVLAGANKGGAGVKLSCPVPDSGPWLVALDSSLGLEVSKRMVRNQ